jgi:O-acetyl-ADP-ribose deacetylase (regulator of RNase III)
MDKIKLILVDPNPSLCWEWREKFADLPCVEIVHGYFEELDEYDCFVSAANSFGMMDGGVDGAIIRYFGDNLMRRVQRRIVEEYLGEQPIGTSMVMETNHPKHPYLAHTPTMRVPMPISRTDNVYTAMWAMLLAVWNFNRAIEAENRDAKRIKIVACPGLGTGTGKVPYPEAARQMALAYRHYLAPPTQPFLSWSFASARQDAVRFGGDLGLIPAKRSAPVV